jgi:large subunit ribosomal protein L31
MKKDIHPTLNPVVFIDMSDGTEFVTMSTLTSEDTKKIDGVDHYVIKVDISSASHPFYTGKQKLIDTAGRVEKFKAKMAKAQAHKGEDESEDSAEDDKNEPEEGAVEAPAVPEEKSSATEDSVVEEDAKAEEVEKEEAA